MSNEQAAVMQQDVIAKIDALLDEAQEYNKYGGSEDADGGLNPGVVDWETLRADILSALQSAFAPAVAPTQLAEPMTKSMQVLMARLANLLDEDQFSECERIVTGAGAVQPVSSKVDYGATITLPYCEECCRFGGGHWNFCSKVKASSAAPAQFTLCAPFLEMDQPWTEETKAEFDAALSAYETTSAPAQPQEPLYRKVKKPYCYCYPADPLTGKGLRYWPVEINPGRTPPEGWSHIVYTEMYEPVESSPIAQSVAQPDDVIEAMRDGIPLTEPVHIAKALLAHCEARAVLAGGTGPLACVMLVNIQMTPWILNEETAKAFAQGYNKALKQLRAALLDFATKGKTAPEAAKS